MYFKTFTINKAQRQKISTHTPRTHLMLIDTRACAFPVFITYIHTDWEAGRQADKQIDRNREIDHSNSSLQTAWPGGSLSPRAQVKQTSTPAVFPLAHQAEMLGKPVLGLPLIITSFMIDHFLSNNMKLIKECLFTRLWSIITIDRTSAFKHSVHRNAPSVYYMANRFYVAGIQW